jgi:hypothetical protein
MIRSIDTKPHRINFLSESERVIAPVPPGDPIVGRRHGGWMNTMKSAMHARQTQTCAR